MKGLETFLSRYRSVATSYGVFTISMLENAKVALDVATSKSLVDHLLLEIEQLADHSFGRELANGDDSARSVITSSDGLAILHRHDKIHGFSSAKLSCSHGVVFLHGVAVAQSFQRKGVGLALSRTLITQMRKPWVACVTQNPIMFCMFRRLCRNVYPNLDEKVPPKNLQDLGIRLAEERLSNMKSSTFVIRREYERCLYDAIPRCADQRANQWFSKALNIRNGRTRDAFLFIGNSR